MGQIKTPLKLGDVEIPCYVLRMNLPDKIVAGYNNPIKFFRPDSGGSQPDTYGYEATLLIDLCDAIIDLKEAGDLKQNQLTFADHASMF